MGGRGATSGNIINLSSRRSAAQSSPAWDYRGYREAVDKIEQAVKDASTRSQVQSAYRAISGQEQSITSELERIQGGADDGGDARVLMSQRRRLRQLRRELVAKGIT